MTLIGQFNGEEVRFDYFPPNQFVAHVPRQINGHYQLYLKCIDAAGNETGLAGVYIYIDFEKMDFKILEKVYSDKVNSNNFNSEILNSKYKHDEENDIYNFTEISHKYSYKVVT